MRPLAHPCECLLCFLLLACVANAVGAADDDFEARVFQGTESQTLPFRLLKPQNYDPQKSYPLILFLHGAGERGEDNKAQLLHVVGVFASQENREKYPCFVVAPQCPEGKRWVEVDWAAKSHTQPKEPSAPMALTVELVKQLQKEFHLDPQRQYVIGLSMGGYGAWDILTRYPNMFAAGVPICGGGDENTAPRIAKLPIWVFHGEVDSVVPTIRSKNMIAALERAGGQPRYTEYPKCDHNSWTPAIQEPDLLPWLFSQKRGS
jgi:predicted peptidase